MQGLLLIVATLIVFIAGYWLHVLGTPYNAILLGIHKLLAVAAIVVVGIHVYNSLQVIDADAGIYLLIGATLVFAIVTIATGAVISVVETPTPILLWSHRLLPYITTVLLAVSYFIGRNQTS